MWLVALLLMSVTHTHAEYSALQTVLSQKGLQQVTHWLADWFQNELSSLVLPEVKGTVRVIFANVEYVLNNMSIQRCDLPEPSVTFSEGTGISLQVNGLSVAIRGNWSTHYGIIDNSGWFDLVMFSVNFNTVLQVGRDKNHLSISTALCSADAKNVQVNFYGGSYFFKSFVKYLSKRITNELPGKICPAFEQRIEDLEKLLAAMPVAMELDPYVYMNISLTDSPLMKGSGLGINVKGEFYSITFPSEPPFPPNRFELPWREDYMVSLGASEFCVNSAAYAYHSAGVLQMHITEDMIPKTFPYHLNTSQFGDWIPQLPKKYPDMPMVLVLYSSESPLFSFNKTVMSVQLFASVKAFALKSDSIVIPLFRLDLAGKMAFSLSHHCEGDFNYSSFQNFINLAKLEQETSCPVKKSSYSAKAYIDKLQLKGVLEMKNLTVMLGSTEIGNFSTGPIEQEVKSLMSKCVLPKVNAQLKDGIQLPFVKGFSPGNSVMTIENGFVAVAMDIRGPYGSWH